jgi:Arc/MetJ-type ribon-helix-helix transcriptional regulator
MLRLHRPLLTNLDDWIGSQQSRPSRPEAIRRLLERALAGPSERSSSKRKVRKASELADRAAEKLVDKSLPLDEQQRRKRAVIKGPKEFRDIREDLPKPKKG